jgi:hypothetical protein
VRERPAHWGQRLVAVHPAPGRRGTIPARCLKLGANTPWKRVRFKRGLGTKAANSFTARQAWSVAVARSPMPSTRAWDVRFGLKAVYTPDGFGAGW